MFALLMEPYAMIQVSVLLQRQRTVVVNFVPGKFGLFRRNPWKPLAETWLKITNLQITDTSTDVVLTKRCENAHPKNSHFKAALNSFQRT